MSGDPNDDAARSGLPQQPEHKPELGFALVLEQACQAFETLQSMIAGRLPLGGADPSSMEGMRYLRPRSTIQMALAHSFLFLSSRAYRICKHGKGTLGLPREERKQFLRDLEPIVDVRDVNEHGYDLNRKSGEEPTRPSMHAHMENQYALDETSVVILRRAVHFDGTPEPV